MASRCLDLADEAAHDPAVAGAKAAALAAALRTGLPVLPGVVVPAAEADEVVRVASAALEHGSLSRARMAVMTVEPDAALLAELRERCAELGEPLIVRSSSPLEAGGTWSGAFSTFHGIGFDDLATALRGCWGSAFSPGVLDRAAHTGTEPSALGLAVLVQPELDPEVGGIARLHADGTVRITSTRGPLRPLMAGDVEGDVVVVGADDRPAGPPLEPAVEVAGLARRVGELLGHRLIEWAYADGRVVLLQSIASTGPGEGDRAGDGGGELVEADLTDAATGVALRVAALTQRWPGRLGDELVLPWAVALERIPPSEPPAGDVSPAELLATARALAAELVAAVWGGSPRAAAASADRVFRQLRGGEVPIAAERLAELVAPSPGPASRLLGCLEALRDALRGSGLIDADALFWRLGPDELAATVERGEVVDAARLGVERWEPFVHAVVMAAGEQRTGTPAAPGAGAGRAHLVTDTVSQAAPDGRRVLIASQPEPGLAPLLWNAAGLVTRAGGTAAHLIEFAHSIGVPTVVSCELPPLDADDPPLVAVDGNTGHVSLAWA